MQYALTQVVNKEINELVGKWNDILNTLSEQFVTWDNLLRNAEETAKENEWGKRQHLSQSMVLL